MCKSVLLQAEQRCIEQVAIWWGSVETKCTHPHRQTHKHTDGTTHAMRTCGDVPDQQGCVCGEGEAMSSAAVQDRVSGNLQRQLGLEVLIGQTVGALRPPIA